MKIIRKLLGSFTFLAITWLGLIGNAYSQGFSGSLDSVCVFEFNDKPYQWLQTRSDDKIWFRHINDSGQAAAASYTSLFPEIRFYDSDSFFGDYAAIFYQFDSEYSAEIFMYLRGFNNEGVLFGDVFLGKWPPPGGNYHLDYVNAFAFSWDQDDGFVDLATEVSGISGRGEIGSETYIDAQNRQFVTWQPNPEHTDQVDHNTPFPYPLRDRQYHIPQAMLDSIALQCGSAPSFDGDLIDSNANLEFVSGRDIVRFPAAQMGVNVQHWWDRDGQIFGGSEGDLADDLGFRVSLNNFGALDLYSMMISLEVAGDNDDAFRIFPGGTHPTALDSGEQSEDFFFFVDPQKVGTYSFEVVVKGLDEFNKSFEIRSRPNRILTINSSEPQLNANLKFTDDRTRSVVGLGETFGVTLEISATEGENSIENIVLTNLFANAPNLTVVSAPFLPPGGFSLEPQKTRKLDWLLKPAGGGSFRLATTVSGTNADNIKVEDSDVLTGAVTSQSLTVEIDISPDEPQIQNEEIGGDPVPIEFTVDARVCNNTDSTITDIRLNSLDVKSRLGIPVLQIVEKISGPVPIAEMALGSLTKFSCVPIPRSTFVANDDFEIEVDALVTGLSSVGARFTDTDEKYLIIKPKYFLEILPEVAIPLPGKELKAGDEIKIAGRVKNLSNSHTLEVGPLYGLLDGNAGAQGFAWTADGVGPDEFIFLSENKELDPGEDVEFSLRISTAASDPRHNGTDEGKPTGGTRAIVKFVPWAEATHPDGEITKIKPEETNVYNVPDELKNNISDLDLNISIDDSISVPVKDPVDIGFGITLGAMDATYNLGVGLLTAPFVLLDGFATLLYATGEYQWRMWDTFTEEEKDIFTQQTGLAVTAIINRHYKYAKEAAPGVLEGINEQVYQQMASMADAWELGDHETVARQYSAAASEGIIGTVVAGAALWKLGKYQKAQEVLSRAQRAEDVRAKALVRLARYSRRDKFTDLVALEEILLTGKPGGTLGADDIVRIMNYTPEEVGKLQSIVNEFPGVMAHTRSKSAGAIKWKKLYNALEKPEPIKAKTVSWLDRLLGYPDVKGLDPGGSMVFKKPDFLVKSELPGGGSFGDELRSFLASKNIHPDDKLYDDAVARLIQRADEWVNYEKLYKQHDRIGWMNITFNTEFNAISDSTITLLRATTKPGDLQLGASRFRRFRLRALHDPDSPFETYVMEMADGPGDDAWRIITGDVDNVAFTRLDGTALDKITHAKVTQRAYQEGLAYHGDSATAASPAGGLRFIAKQSEGSNGKQELLTQFRGGALPRLVRFNEKKSSWIGPGAYRMAYDGGHVTATNSLPPVGPRVRVVIPNVPKPSVPAPNMVAKSISAPSYNGATNVGRCNLVYSEDPDASSVIMGQEGALANVGIDGTITPSELHDICFGDGDAVSITIAPSSMLTADVEAGSTKLPVLENGTAASTTGASTVGAFAIGQTIVIGADTNHPEVRRIVGLGSIILDQPLAFNHSAEEVVIVVEQADQTAPDIDEADLAFIESLIKSASGSSGTLKYTDGVLNFAGNVADFNLAVDSVEPVENGTKPGALFTDDAGVIINSNQEQSITIHGGLLDPELLETILLDFDLVFNYTSGGRIVLGGELNTGETYYSMLPSVTIDHLAANAVEGIRMTPSDKVQNLTLVSLVSTDSGSPRKQTLFPAPIDWVELQNGFLALPGVEEVTLGIDGLITVTLDGVDHKGIMNYEVARAAGDIGQTTVKLSADVNGDGLPDVLVTYPDGNVQVMFYLGSQ